MAVVCGLQPLLKALKMAYRRDSSFVKPYHPPTDGTPMADIAIEDQEVETRHARLSLTIRLPERCKDFVMDKPK